MPLRRELKVGDWLHCYGAIDSQVQITKESMELQSKNEDQQTMYVDHDGELKKVSVHILYHESMPIEQSMLNEHQHGEMIKEMKEAGLL